MSKILVTGASGFVGKYLCKKLYEEGHDVVAVMRSKTASIQAPEAVSVLVPDLAQLDDSSRIFDQCDAVIHLAARAHVLKESAANPLADFRRINVDITLKLMRLAASAGVKRFVFVSSIGVNGNSTFEHRFVETDKENPHDLYAISKFEAEQLIRTHAAHIGIEFVIIRPALVFGPDAPGNFGLLMKLAAKKIPLPVGSISAKRNIVSIWNLVDFLSVCATHPAAAGEIFLVADGQDIVLPDILRHLGKGMNKKQYIISIPGNIMSCFFSLSGKKKTFEKLNAELLVSIEKARVVLQWQPLLDTCIALERTGKEYMMRARNEKII